MHCGTGKKVGNVDRDELSGCLAAGERGQAVVNGPLSAPDSFMSLASWTHVTPSYPTPNLAPNLTRPTSKRTCS